MPHQRTLLAVFAHPDDESFGPGGTLARYAAQGVHVWLVCATGGEAGEIAPTLMAEHRRPEQVRAAELCCAAQILGLQGVEWLGYRDSGMAGSPDNQHPRALIRADRHRLVGQVVEILRRRRPQVVITFDPHGGYGHPDHIAIHEATVAAFHAAGDAERYPEQLAAGLEPYRPQKLYFTAINRTWLRWMVRLLRLRGQDPTRVGVNQDINLLQVLAWESPVHARIDVRRYLERKEAASRCHRSQMGPQGLFGPLPAFVRRHWQRFETFTRAWPEPQPGEPPERDLFAGVPR